MEVGQIVRCPRREQLAERHRAKDRMAPSPVEVTWLQVQRPQVVEALRTDASELVKQLRQRSALAFALLRQAIETLEGLRLAELEDHLRPRNPVGPLAV